jgi:hypothetical protein
MLRYFNYGFPPSLRFNDFMAHHRTHYIFRFGEIQFLIAPVDQDGQVRLYPGGLQTGDPLGAFSSARDAFAAIYRQHTGSKDWDSIEPEKARSAAMEQAHWWNRKIAFLTDRRDRTVESDNPDQIPPLIPPHSSAL